MKTGARIAFLIAACCGACNTAPPGPDYAGLYYPVGKPAVVDSSEVLRVARLEGRSFEFTVAGNRGVGKAEDGIVAGELKGTGIGKAPFTFLQRADGVYEFRALGSKVELVRLPAAP
ncbi:MAG: hypothetical protein EOO11_00370 [Chitinophagaceae bacterium]|nr:MAG: hypothetical protein EOO11_00370 [Chitinophagaceae bacterium]